MKAVRTICMVMLVAAPAVAFAQDKSYYPATPPLYDWSKFQPPETGSRLGGVINQICRASSRAVRLQDAQARGQKCSVPLQWGHQAVRPCRCMTGQNSTARNQVITHAISTRELTKRDSISEVKNLAYQPRNGFGHCACGRRVVDPFRYFSLPKP